MWGQGSHTAHRLAPVLVAAVPTAGQPAFGSGVCRVVQHSGGWRY